MDFAILLLTLTPDDVERANAIIDHEPTITSVEEAITWALAHAPVPQPDTPAQPPVQPAPPPSTVPTPSPIIVPPGIRPGTHTWLQVNWIIDERSIKAALKHPAGTPQPRAKITPITLGIDAASLIALGAKNVTINPGRHAIILESKVHRKP